MEPTIQVGDFDREAIDGARTIPSEDKLREGLRLFDRTCRIMSAGIQDEHPNADPGKSCACCASAFASRDRSSAGLVLLLNDVPVDALAARIGLEFELDTKIAFETVTGSRRLVARARDSAFTVELFDLTNDPHDRERFARRRPVAVRGRTVAVPTPEDVIITKLGWWQRAGRHKDLEDARNVVAVQRSALDREYWRRWCGAVGVSDILEDIERSLERE